MTNFPGDFIKLSLGPGRAVTLATETGLIPRLLYGGVDDVDEEVEEKSKEVVLGVGEGGETS